MELNKCYTTYGKIAYPDKVASYTNSPMNDYNRNVLQNSSNDAKTFSITSYSIMTLSIIGFIVTRNIMALGLSIECH